MPRMTRCQCLKKDGQQCINNAKPSSQFCGIAAHQQCQRMVMGNKPVGIVTTKSPSPPKKASPAKNTRGLQVLQSLGYGEGPLPKKLGLGNLAALARVHPSIMGRKGNTFKTSYAGEFEKRQKELLPWNGQIPDETYRDYLYLISLGYSRVAAAKFDQAGLPMGVVILYPGETGEYIGEYTDITYSQPLANAMRTLLEEREILKTLVTAYREVITAASFKPHTTLVALREQFQPRISRWQVISQKAEPLGQRLLWPTWDWTTGIASTGTYRDLKNPNKKERVLSVDNFKYHMDRLLNAFWKIATLLEAYEKDPKAQHRSPHQ